MARLVRMLQINAFSTHSLLLFWASAISAGLDNSFASFVHVTNSSSPLNLQPLFSISINDNASPLKRLIPLVIE